MNSYRALVSKPCARGGRASSLVAKEMHERRPTNPVYGHFAKLGHLEKNKKVEKAYVLRNFTKAQGPRKADLSEDGLGRLKSSRMAELATTEGLSMLESEAPEGDAIQNPDRRTSTLRHTRGNLALIQRKGTGLRSPIQDRWPQKL